MIKLVKKKTIDEFASFEYFKIFVDGEELEKTEVSKSIDYPNYSYNSRLGEESRKLANIEINEFKPFNYISLYNLFKWLDFENNLSLSVDGKDKDSPSQISLEISINPNVANWNKGFSIAEFYKSFEKCWNNSRKSVGILNYNLDPDDMSLWLSNIIPYENKSVWSLISESEILFKEIYEKAIQKLLMKNKGTLKNKTTKYDFFISHASEDKEVFVRPLAEALRNAGFKVWYDEFELKIGDKLRRSIDTGLANSKFGIVVISPDFFKKNWTQYEFDGLVQREMLGEKAILPLWHKVSKDEVIQFSPSLADTVALNTTTFTIDELVNKLSEVLK